MVVSPALTRALEFLPVIRDVFGHAEPTVQGRERVMQQLRTRVFEHDRYVRLTRQAQAFLAGYVTRCMEGVYGVEDERELHNP